MAEAAKIFRMSGLRRFLAATVVISLLAANSGCSPDRSDEQVSTSEASSLDQGQIDFEKSAKRVSVNFPVPVANKFRLAGFVDAVFVGRVESVRADRVKHRTPWTRATVKVLERLKGELSETVDLEQQGGEDPSSGLLTLVEGDSLVQEKRIYLFAVRAAKERGAYVIVPQYGDVHLPGGVKDKTVDEWRDAVKNAAPYQN